MLNELEQALSSAGIRHAIAGGIAMAAHGRVRATEDVDVLVEASQAQALHAVMHQLGYAAGSGGAVATRFTRNPLAELPALGEWVDVLFAKHESGRSLIARALFVSVPGWSARIPVVDAAGLVLMKALALANDPSRHGDADDIRYLLDAQRARIDMGALRADAAAIGGDVSEVLAGLLPPRLAEPRARQSLRL